NDPDALVPALKKATQRGIKVISWDSGVAPEGRILQLNPSSNELIGKMCLTLVKDHLDGGKGDFAILSATTTSTNQNIWIDQMKKQLKDFPG
ncbi:substrate-binding domain-containing protein, partial [Rhizobium ruizarguesonis]